MNPFGEYWSLMHPEEPEPVLQMWAGVCNNMGNGNYALSRKVPDGAGGFRFVKDEPLIWATEINGNDHVPHGEHLTVRLCRGTEHSPWFFVGSTACA